MKVSKNTYLQCFGYVVILLALYRCAVLERKTGEMAEGVNDTIPADSLLLAHVDTISTSEILKLEETVSKGKLSSHNSKENLKENPKANLNETQNGNSDVSPKVSEPVVAATSHSNMQPHPIYSVPSFKKTFPDTQDDHLQGVKQWGVKAVKDRQEAEKRMSELVYIGASPFFYVENLRQSIPYLVPRAAILLHDIGTNFFDSLYVKGVPLHKIIVSSALRTKDDVTRLQKHNFNATENSCHLYGTTIDICYNRYLTVANPAGEKRRAVQNDTLKWILSEVLRDLRNDGRCYVKHEVKQGCFHITVRK